MSMMNANAAATTAMTANEPLDFELPEMGDSDFSNEELAEDMDGLTMSFPRIKIPAGGVLQFEIPNGDPQHPDYSPTLTGVILFSHASCVYWPEGDEYSDDVPPLCSSVDGKQGYGEPGRNLCVEPVWQRQQRPRQSLQEYAGAVPVAQRGVYAAGDQSFAHQHQPVPRVFESGFCIPQACHLRQPCGDRLEAPDKPGGQGLQRCHVQAAWRFPRRPACFRAQVRLELP